jgi:hypothetical protein
MGWRRKRQRTNQTPTAMFRGLLQFFLLNKLLGGGRGDGGPGRRRGGLGCFGFILLLVVIYFVYQYFFNV